MSERNKQVVAIEGIIAAVISVGKLALSLLLVALALAVVVNLAGFNNIPLLKEFSTADKTGTAAIIAALAYYLKG